LLIKLMMDYCVSLGDWLKPLHGTETTCQTSTKSQMNKPC